MVSFVEYLNERFDKRSKFVKKKLMKQTKNFKGKEYQTDEYGYLYIDPKSVNYNKREYEKVNSLDSEMPRVYRDGGAKIITSDHARSQAKDRRPQMDSYAWKKLFAKIMDERGLSDGQHYVFYSKSLQQGVVAIYDDGNVIVKTTLPKGANDPTIGSKGFDTELILMESLKEHNQTLDDIIIREFD